MVLACNSLRRHFEVLEQFASERSGRSNRPRSYQSECAAGGRYGALETVLEQFHMQDETHTV